MEYRLTKKIKSCVFFVEKRWPKDVYLIPCNLKYEKRYPPYNHQFKTVINFRVDWLIWEFKLAFRKYRKNK